jgi:hypothetical protein
MIEMKMNEPQISINDITSDILTQLPDDKGKKAAK